MAKGMQASAQRLVDLRSVVGERHVVHVTAGANLNPVILSSEQPPKRRGDGVKCYRIHSPVGDEWSSIDLQDTEETYHYVQPLGKDQWLLVRARANDERDLNAHVFGSNGSPLSSFHAGDGIADVQVSERENIWFSYFDVGVFGDTALGCSGLSCLDRLGGTAFRFTDLGSDRVVQSMADCYALNVCSDRETWLYYYTDFPLVKLEEKRIAKWWRMPVAGSHAIAVDGGRALLGGSYKNKKSLFLVDLDTLACKEVTPVTTDGRPLSTFRAFGRRHNLYLATDESLYVVSLTTTMQSVESSKSSV